MDKRTLMALIMIMALFLIFNQFVWKPQAEQQQQVQPQPQPVTTPLKPDIITTETVSTPEVVLEGIDTAIEVNDEIKLRNNLMEVTLSNRGAYIRQVRLLNFKMPDASPVTLIPGDGKFAALTLKTPQGDISLADFTLQYSIEENQRGVVFYIQKDDAKVFSLNYALNDDYGIRYTFEINNWEPVNGTILDLSTGIADTEARLKTKDQDYRFILNANNKISKENMEELGTGKTEPVSSFRWAAVRSKYFVLAAMESGADYPTLTNQYTAFTKTYINEKQEQTQSPAFLIESSHRDYRNTWSQSFWLYCGPTDFEILKQYGNDLELIVERGAKWLLWLSNIFAAVLTFLHKLIPNYGVVIIIFSILLKIVLYPLTLKTTRSMIKMQQIQPRIQELQRRFKDDKARQQKELMQLYKETGTNPFSGCWPFLLQMPIFFSLFNVLRYSLEMRNAHFVGWITDLSEPDPYLVLPILMAVFMVVQQRMMRPPVQNPADMDDKQRAAVQSTKIMAWIMPIMMFFIFKGMPAGLVLYWTTFNILSVIHQYYIQKHFRQKEGK